MFISMLTILNILFLLLSITLFYSSHKKRKKQAAQEPLIKDVNPPSEADVLEIYQNAVSKIMHIRHLHMTSGKKLENATKNSVQQLSNILSRLETTTEKTTEILDMMREKISLSIVRDTVESPGEQNAEAIRGKYEKMLNEVHGQLSMLFERKTEDIRKLEEVRTRISLVADKMRDGGYEEVYENELKQAVILIEGSVSSLQEATDVESVFIHSTMRLLQDVVTSFVQLKTIIDNNLGESSSLEDEIGTIIVSLQCEDICKEMSRYTLEILSSLMDDLHRLDILGIAEDEFLEIDAAEASADSEPDDEQDEEAVTFF